MEDAAGFFANVFGGERFKDYVSPYSLRSQAPPGLPVDDGRLEKFPS